MWGYFRRWPLSFVIFCVCMSLFPFFLELLVDNYYWFFFIIFFQGVISALFLSFLHDCLSLSLSPRVCVVFLVLLLFGFVCSLARSRSLIRGSSSVDDCVNDGFLRLFLVSRWLLTWRDDCSRVIGKDCCDDGFFSGFGVIVVGCLVFLFDWTIFSVENCYFLSSGLDFIVEHSFLLISFWKYITLGVLKFTGFPHFPFQPVQFLSTIGEAGEKYTRGRTNKNTANALLGCDFW